MKKNKKTKVHALEGSKSTEMKVGSYLMSEADRRSVAKKVQDCIYADVTPEGINAGIKPLELSPDYQNFIDKLESTGAGIIISEDDVNRCLACVNVPTILLIDEKLRAEIIETLIERTKACCAERLFELGAFEKK